MQATKVFTSPLLGTLEYPIAENIVDNRLRIKKMAEELRRVFDTDINFVNLVCTGCSGAMISSIIAYIIPQVRKIYYIRKPHEVTHDSTDITAPKPGELNIFVDDFIETGGTLKEVIRQFPYKLHGIVVSGSVGHRANENTKHIRVDTVLCYNFYPSD